MPHPPPPCPRSCRPPPRPGTAAYSSPSPASILSAWASSPLSSMKLKSPSLSRPRKLRPLHRLQRRPTGCNGATASFATSTPQCARATGPRSRSEAVQLSVGGSVDGAAARPPDLPQPPGLHPGEGAWQPAVQLPVPRVPGPRLHVLSDGPIPAVLILIGVPLVIYCIFTVLCGWKPD